MNLRMLRTWVGLVLGVSGALMFAASWQRWTRWCLSSTDDPLRGCAGREDNLYHFLPPAEPWEPVGSSAELALVSVGVATLRSGLSGEVVEPWLGGWVDLGVVVAAAGVGCSVLGGRSRVGARSLRGLLPVDTFGRAVLLRER
jgi:hypothetical protein